MAVAMFAMIITGYLIGRPLVSNLGDTWITYDFGYVRMVHFAAGAVLHGALHLPPLLGGGGQPLREDDLLPAAVVDEVVEGVFAQVAYYLFMRKSAPEYAGHKPACAARQFAMFVLGSFVIIITGLALYAQSWGWDTSWMAWFGWVFVLFGDAQAVRTVHHVMMYVFILFSIAHIYMSFREDVMGGATTPPR